MKIKRRWFRNWYHVGLGKYQISRIVVNWQVAKKYQAEGQSVYGPFWSEVSATQAAEEMEQQYADNFKKD